MSEIALGTWGLASGSYGPVPPGRLAETIERGLEVGVTTIDMAPVWGSGESERVVGRVVGSRRDRMQYITRGGVRDVRGELVRRFAAEDLVSDCEESLERLDTDRIDVWLLHNPPEETLRQDDWREAAQRLKESGKIRAWGVTVGSRDQARMALAARTQVLCLVHNMLASADLEDLDGEIWMSACGVLARSPLAYGLLANKWKDPVAFHAHDHRRARWSGQALRRRIEQVGMLEFLTHGGTRDLATAAIRYVLSNKVVSSVLVGARSPEQIAHAAACSDGPPYLPDGDLARIPQVLASSGA